MNRCTLVVDEQGQFQIKLPNGDYLPWLAKDDPIIIEQTHPRLAKVTVTIYCNIDRKIPNE